MKYLTCKIESKYSDLCLPLASDRLPIIHFNRANGELDAEIAGYVVKAGTTKVVDRLFAPKSELSSTTYICFWREFEILLRDKFCAPKGNGEWEIPALSYDTTRPMENAKIYYILFGDGYTQGTTPATEINSASQSHNR